MNQSRSLKLIPLVLLLTLVLPALAFAQGGNNNNRNRLAPQPVLIYTVAEVAGTGDTGPSDDQDVTTMIVYNSGLVLMVTNGADNTTGGGSGCNVQTATVSQQEMGEFLRDLRRAGALRGQGGPRRMVEGERLVTITILSGVGGNSTNALANTYSFFVGQDQNGLGGRLQNLINNFMNSAFGGDNGGSGTGS